MSDERRFVAGGLAAALDDGSGADAMASGDVGEATACLGSSWIAGAPGASGSAAAGTAATPTAHCRHVSQSVAESGISRAQEAQSFTVSPVRRGTDRGGSRSGKPCTAGRVDGAASHPAPQRAERWAVQGCAISRGGPVPSFTRMPARRSGIRVTNLSARIAGQPAGLSQDCAGSRNQLPASGFQLPASGFQLPADWLSDRRGTRRRSDGRSRAPLRTLSPRPHAPHRQCGERARARVDRHRRAPIARSSARHEWADRQR